MTDPTGRRGRRGGWGRWLLLVVVVVLVNLPLVSTQRRDHAVDAHGTEVVATVVDTGRLGDGYGVDFRFPRATDPAQHTWSARVDHATYDLARSTRHLDVRVVPGSPSEYRTAGQQRGDLPLVLAVAGDALVLLVLGLALGLGRRLARTRPAVLHLTAVDDVARARPGASVTRLDGADGIYDVVGEVVTIEEGRVVLECGERQVVVDLDGHANRVGHQQPARVRGRLTDSGA